MKSDGVMMRLTVLGLLLIVFILGYLVLEKGGKNNQLKSGISLTQKGLTEGKDQAISSVKTLRTSLLLHLTETAIEDASKDLLDKNFGKANDAVMSALKDLDSINELNPGTQGLDSVKDNLNSARKNIADMDARAINELLKAQTSIRQVLSRQDNF